MNRAFDERKIAFMFDKTAKRLSTSKFIALGSGHTGAHTSYTTPSTSTLTGLSWSYRQAVTGGAPR